MPGRLGLPVVEVAPRRRPNARGLELALQLRRPQILVPSAQTCHGQANTVVAAV
jgi:hypothetical protein